MDNKNNMLDRLLMGAKSAKPVLKVEDAFELIKNHEVKSLSRFNLKFFTIMSTSIVIIAAFVGGMLMMEPAQKTDTVVSEPEKSFKQEIPEWRKEPAELPTTVNSEKPARSQLKKNTALIAVVDTPILQKQETTLLMDNEKIEVQPPFEESITKQNLQPKNEQGSLISSDTGCKEDPGYIHLNESELKKVGIIVKDDVIAFEQKNTSFNGRDVRFFIDTKTGIRSMRYTDASKRGSKEQLYPQIVSDCRSQVQFLIDKEDHKAVENTPENYLPVRVNVSGLPTYYVFWFKRSEKMLKLFPERIREEVEADNKKYVFPFKQKAFKSTVPPIRQESVKPEKMDLAADSQTVTASPELLKKLGVELTEEGLLFERADITLRSVNTNRYYNIPIQVSGFQRLVDPSLNKLKPYFLSSEFYYLNDESFYTSLRRSIETGTKDNFLNKRHSLLALKIIHPKGGTFMFWYPLAKDLLAELPAEDVERIRTYVKNKEQGLLSVSEKHPAHYQDLDELLTDSKATSEAIHALILDSAALLNLGIQLNQNHISHVYVAEGNKPMRFVYNMSGTMSAYMDQNDNAAAEIAGKYLKLVTDDLGQSKKAVTSSTTPNVNALIPVLVRTGKDYTFSDKVSYRWRPDLIFWFEPTEEFLTLLPKEIADEIRKNTRSVFHSEKTEILSSEKNKSCNYVEVCRNKKGMIEKAGIFPNPANTGTDISIEAPTALELKVKLTAVNGALVKESAYSFDGKGKGKFHFSTKDVPPGIYLLIITSDQGDAIYERLVIIK